jgi:hypothetical protein
LNFLNLNISVRLKKIFIIAKVLIYLMDHSGHHELAANHGFLMLGTKTIYLCHLPMYHMPAHAFQTIVEAEIGRPELEKYLKIKKETPAKPIIVLNDTRMALEDLVNSNFFLGTIYFSDENGDAEDRNNPIGNTTVNIKKILLFKQLSIHTPDYPENVEYYMFGTEFDWHLSHFLSKSPNFEQELDISISGNLPASVNSFVKILIPSVNEKSQQHITKDPLTQDEYRAETENGDQFQISIINRFWINNSMLNPS